MNGRVRRPKASCLGQKKKKNCIGVTSQTLKKAPTLGFFSVPGPMQTGLQVRFTHLNIGKLP